MAYLTISTIFICLSILHCNVGAASVSIGVDGASSTAKAAAGAAAKAASDATATAANAANKVAANIEGKSPTGASLAVEGSSKGNSDGGIAGAFTNALNSGSNAMESLYRGALNAAATGNLLAQFENQLEANSNLPIPGLGSILTATGEGNGAIGSSGSADINNPQDQLQKAIELLAVKQGLNEAVKQYINMGDRGTGAVSAGFRAAGRNGGGIIDNGLASFGVEQPGVASMYDAAWKTMDNGRANVFNAGRQFADGALSSSSLNFEPIQRLGFNTPLSFARGNNGITSRWGTASLPIPSSQVETEINV